MNCPRCGSPRTHAQIVTSTQIVAKHHGCLWWLLVGWWWIPIKWLIFTVPALIVKIFAPKRNKLVQTHTTLMICDNCGNTWAARR